MERVRPFKIGESPGETCEMTFQPRLAIARVHAAHHPMNLSLLGDEAQMTMPAHDQVQATDYSAHPPQAGTMTRSRATLLQHTPVALSLALLFIQTRAFALPAGGDIPDYDFQWATITDVGNPAYQGGPFGELAGRGSVNYVYRISRLELTSAQMLEFANTFPQIPVGTWYGGSSGILWDVVGPYQLNPDIPNAGMVPVMGMSWRTAAMYCNWLHNGKGNDPNSLLSGAYDVSTFGTNPDGTFTDQLTHSPGAKFWIPTLDEWLKGAHYDPNRYGPGQGGWWLSVNGTDEPLINGPPGIGQTSGAGTYQWGFPGPFYIPLGSYTDVQSPWGLWDLSGGVQEWTEEIVHNAAGAPMYRYLEGSRAGAGESLAILDLIYGSSWDHPFSENWSGLRIASAIPGAGTLALFAIGSPFFTHKRRRKS